MPAASRAATFARQIRRLRKRGRLSQPAAAQACGVAQRTWARYESGERVPAAAVQRAHLAALARAAVAAARRPKVSVGPTFADQVRAVVEQHDLEVPELAAAVGRTPRTVFRWLAGEREPEGAAGVLARLRERWPG